MKTMEATYTEIKARHALELTALGLMENILDPEVIQTEAHRIRESETREIRAAFDDDPDGSGFTRQIMLDGVFYGMSASEILRADGLEPRSSEDCAKV